MSRTSSQGSRHCRWPRCGAVSSWRGGHAAGGDLGLGAPDFGEPHDHGLLHSSPGRLGTPTDNPQEPVIPDAVGVGRKVPAYPGGVVLPLADALAAGCPLGGVLGPRHRQVLCPRLGARAPATGRLHLVRARDQADVVAVLAGRRRPAASLSSRAGRPDRAGRCGLGTPGTIILNVEGPRRLIDINDVEGYAVVSPGW